jgi:alpha/beta superfamily hydrolase
MNSHTKKALIEGPVGHIEIAIDQPDSGLLSSSHSESTKLKGLVLVAHPHPLLGGTMNNKVAQTLARTFTQMHYVAVRSNFRGVGETQGVHDHGIGEQDDLMAVLRYMRAQPEYAALPLVLAGFSFGTFVISHLAVRLAEQGEVVQRLVFVGTASTRFDIANVPKGTIVIHGENDEVIPLSDVFAWARPQDLPITVLPGAGHFFHRKLHILREIVQEAWRA